jgi:8-amino-7-oxononanoate synthase
VTSALIAGLERGLAAREVAGLQRIRHTLTTPQGVRVVVDGRELVAFASNDYLGLANHPEVVAAASEGALRWGAGAGASHLICGHFAPHAALESELAAFARPCAGARALTFSSGYLANLAILTALAGRGDAIFADRLNHACLNDGALLSRAEFVRYPHADMVALRQRLTTSKAKRRLIATDAVFSMDGDLAPLPALCALAEEFDAWLVVDDAHGFGVLGTGENGGRGSLAHFGLASERIVYMGTLGKAAGVAGAFVAAHPAVIETLVQTARSYVFTTAAPPLAAEALRAGLRILRDDTARRAHLFALITRFRSRLGGGPWTLPDSPTPIQPLIVGANATAVDLAAALWRRGFWVPAIRPPTVPKGTARLRVTLSAAHAREDVDALADALAELAPAFGRTCAR